MALIRLVLVLAAAFYATAASAEWRRGESANFIVYSQNPESRLRERILLLEDFDRLLRLLIAGEQQPSRNKLHVYVLPRSRDLQRVRAVGPSVGGFYTSSAEGIAAFVGDDAGSRSNHILFHEYAHHFMLQNSQSSNPAWYVEGFAEYFATAKFTKDSIDIGNFEPNRASWLVAAQWLPWDRVLSGTGAGLTPQGSAMFYAQAWLLTHYFYSNAERQASFRRYLAAVPKEGPVRALQTATGMDPKRLDDELRKYIRGGRINYRRLERSAAAAASSAAVPVQISTMSPAAADLLLHQAQLRIGIAPARRPEALRSIRAAAARHSNDPLARRVLAHAELLFGDRAAALKLLEPLIAANPNDAELMYLRGRLHLEAAEAGEDGHEAQAKTWFARAHEIDPNHFQTLYRYAQSLRGGREAASENTSNILLLAHQLAPQVPEIRLNAAAALLARGDNDIAETLLAPLLSDPHDPVAAANAKKMLDEARSRAAPAAAAAGPAKQPADASE